MRYKYRALIYADFFDYNFGFLSSYFHVVVAVAVVVVLSLVYCASPWRIFINLLQPRATDFTLIQFICRYTRQHRERQTTDDCGNHNNHIKRRQLISQCIPCVFYTLLRNLFDLKDISNSCSIYFDSML